MVRLPELFPDQMSPEELAAQKEMEDARVAMIDQATQQAHVARLESLVELLQHLTEPTAVDISNIKYMVLKDFGLGYIAESDVESIMLNLQAAQLYLMLGALTMCRMTLEQVVDRLFLSRSIGGRFIKQLLTTTVEKRMVAVTPEKRSWMG